MNIREKLSAIQADFKAKKSRKNNFGNYMFRSAEDILEALKPFNEKYKVHTIINEVVREVNGQIIMESTAVMCDCESDGRVTATAIVGVDLSQRGMNLPQQFGSASSYAKKYALGNLLLIDDTQDADATNKHGKESLPKLIVNSDKWLKAVEYIKGGGDIANIKSNYTISSADEKTLQALKTK